MITVCTFFNMETFFGVPPLNNMSPVHLVGNYAVRQAAIADFKDRPGEGLMKDLFMPPMAPQAISMNKAVAITSICLVAMR